MGYGSGAASVKSKWYQSGRSVQGRPTSIGGVPVITERGPIGQRVAITSPASFRKVFGGVIANANAQLPPMLGD